MALPWSSPARLGNGLSALAHRCCVPSRCLFDSAAGAPLPPAQESAVPETRVLGVLQNAPKDMIKEELLGILHGCNLTPDRAYSILDEKLRFKYWRLEFKSRMDFARASEIIQRQERIGNRPVKLRPLLGPEAQAVTDAVNVNLREFKDQSLLVIGAPDDVRIESIERFFYGYALAPRGIWHFWIDSEPNPNRNYMRDQRNRQIPGLVVLPNQTREKRVAVKFATRAEAFRALREKQGAFLQENSVRLSLIQ